MQPDLIATKHPESVSEYAVWAANAILKRSWLYFLAVVIATPIAFYVRENAPREYVSETTLLTQPANQATGSVTVGTGMQGALEQMRLIEIWLESEQNLTDILPALLNGDVPTDPVKLASALDEIRDALQFELVGQSIVQVRLRGARAKGLGRKLELILVKLLSGLLEPNSGVLGAPQLLISHWRDEVQFASDDFTATLADAGIGDSAELRESLHRIGAFKRGLARAEAGIAPETSAVPEPARFGVAEPAHREQPSRQNAVATAKVRLDRARTGLNIPSEQLKPLETAYERWEVARKTLEELNNRWGGESGNYVGIFSSPDRLTIIGRPKDPVLGKSTALKTFAALALVSLLWPSILIVFFELMDMRVKLRSQFESLGNIPVIARY